MTAKFVSSSEFHLFIDDDLEVSSGVAEDDGTAPLPRAVEPLVLAQGPVQLDMTPRGAGIVGPDRFQLQPTTAMSPARSPRFEPITGRGARPRLLLVTDAACPALVNGCRAPRLTLLGPGDRLRFDDTCAFRVAIYHRPSLGPVPAELQGAACPICTIPLAVGDRCLVCPCGAPFHAAEDESIEGALACARMATECPRCQQPIRLTPGYDTATDILHE